VGFGGVIVLSGWTPALTTLGMSAQSATMAYSLSVLPLFVLMGNLVAGAGISANLFKAAQLFVGRQRGGVAMGTVLACGGFGAICARASPPPRPWRASQSPPCASWATPTG
jgi:TRAP-type mannitol/chloroaromatic compound transport system permease large subunit